MMNISADNKAAGSRKGHIFVISGPSGAGKDTIIEGAQRQLKLHQVITATTRPKRDTEIAGVHYLFMTNQQFLDLRASGGMLESAQVYEYWYGIPYASVQKAIDNGLDTLIKVDTQGAKTLKQILPQSTFIFIRPERVEDLRNRLSRRNSETDEQLHIRIQKAEAELQEQVWFDYVVVNANGRQEATIALVIQLIQQIILSQK